MARPTEWFLGRRTAQDYGWRGLGRIHAGVVDNQVGMSVHAGRRQNRRWRAVSRHSAEKSDTPWTKPKTALREDSGHDIP